MNIQNNPVYKEDIEYVANLMLPWDLLKNKRILLSGVSGMIGSFLIDVLMYRNEFYNDNCFVLGLGRDKEKARIRFDNIWESEFFSFENHDINVPLNNFGDFDYIIHAASNTHPVAYASDPIGTITTNVIGTYNLLNYAVASKVKRFLFASSVEIYGENRGDVEGFDESYSGYINCNTLRAGYPESKRVGEALCQAFMKQHRIDVVNARLSRTYGPTMQLSDTKALSQFIKRAVSKESIILKSEGTQLYSYNYIADTVAGILVILFRGISGEVYNISDKGSDITLKELAYLLASEVNTNVIFEMPEIEEKLGYSKATKAIMNSTKLQSLGWKARYDIEDGLKRTIKILSEAR
ncbi:NAD-dependent epimerase/dehydratase family protein [Paenibacillus piscarius]|uniref:NAD-dependent epimerase/dehydratase family protein n=1 Tax=Paenibacillus piscarius TaxID=1089681 RepID=UPI001EE8CF65|nr:NAD-dependent epimerase/dehydratase family protein [Paenibacillus piscarius]